MRDRAAEEERSARDPGKVAGLAAGAVVVPRAKAPPADPVGSTSGEVQHSNWGTTNARGLPRKGGDKRSGRRSGGGKSLGVLGEFGAGVGGGHPPSGTQAGRAGESGSMTLTAAEKGALKNSDRVTSGSLPLGTLARRAELTAESRSSDSP